MGQPHRELAAQRAVPRLSQHQFDERRLHQPDEADRPAHDQDRLLQHAQLQGAATPGLGRLAELLERHQQPTRYGLRLRHRGARRVLVVQPVLAVRRGAVRLQQY